MKKSLLLGVLVSVVFCGIAFSMDFSPMLNASLMGGQYTYESESASSGGNVNINFVPAMKFSDKFSLMPIYYFEYSNVKNVIDPVGNGAQAVTTKSMGNNLSVKPIFSIGKDMKIKGKVGYMLQYSAETNDEDLGNGLFDYNKMTVGAELAVGYFGTGVNMYTIKFPHYNTLILAQESGVPIASTDTEHNPGDYTLDFNANEIYVYKKFLVSENFILDTSLNYTMKNFVNQKLSIEESKYLADLRNDKTTSVSVNPQVRIIPEGPYTLSAGLNLAWASNSSNQNYYDAGANPQPKYIADYYGYTETGITPAVVFSLNAIPLNFSLGYKMVSRQYSGRLAQDADGVYVTDKTKVDTTQTDFTVNYPVLEKLSILTRISMYNSSSNNRSSSPYQYNYKTSNYFLGLTYEL